MNKTSSHTLTRFAQELQLIQNEILQNLYGLPEEHFMTTRELSELKGISLVTAHNIMKELCASGYIRLQGKKYILAHSELAESHKTCTKILGLIVPSINNEFYSSLAEALITLAGRKGYRILVMNTSYSYDEEQKAHELLTHLHVAGIISCVPVSSQNAHLYRYHQIPCILLAHSCDESNTSSVQVNSFSISQKAAQHLIDQGYRNFVYAGTQKIPLDTDDRYTGFHMELNRQGFSLTEENTFILPQNLKSDHKALIRFLSETEEPVGIYCYHDLIAAYLYKLCTRIGKRIPQDIGIIGFDDLSIATHLAPPLTTIQFRISSMADTALKLLFEKMKNPKKPYENYYIEPQLIIRQSTQLSE